MQLKYDNNKEMTLSLHVYHCIPIATKGPHIDTLHFEEKSLNSFYLIIILWYTISLVANKLGKNMLVFAEGFSYSQDDKKVLLSKVKIITFTLFPRAIKNEKFFLFGCV